MEEAKIVQKLIEHDQKLEQLVTKEEFANFRNEVFSAQDETLKILRRLDQERIFTIPTTCYFSAKSISRLDV